MENAIGGITDISIDFTLSFKPLNNCCFNTQLDECIQKKKMKIRKTKISCTKQPTTTAFYWRPWYWSLLFGTVHCMDRRPTSCEPSRINEQPYVDGPLHPPSGIQFPPIPRCYSWCSLKKNALRSGEDSTGGHTLLISPHSHSVIQAQSRL